MKCKHPLLLAVLLLTNFSLIFAQSEAPQTPSRTLRNGDVLRLHRAGMKPSEIVARIVTSECNFDTFPQVLRELKSKGLPDTVIMAMVMVPYGPPARTALVVQPPEPAAATARVHIPAGTLIHVEPTAPVSSGHATEGDQISFMVSRRVVVNGVVVIERGAAVKARVVKSKPAAAWGRGGLLGWVLEDVVAIDGSRVPISLSERLAGKTRSKAVVAAAIATGAAILPYSTPVGLIWALKKGDEAVLDENRKSTAIVSSNTEVAGLLPKPKKAIYHSAEKLKNSDPGKGKGWTPMNNSFKASKH
jgi:hypothetical protein